MNDINQTAKLVCYAFLNMIPKEQITDDIILKIIKEKIESAPEFKDADFANLFEVIRSECEIGKGKITVMSDDIDPWLSEEKSNINFELWNRYKLFMSQNDPSFPVNELDDFTDKILDKCVNPKDNNSWDRRGMVVGHVQSGKTSNYVGLINKATDSGYKVIIVIAGTISSLRRQTQERIDAGFIGRSSSAFIRENENRLIGVGKLKVETDIYSLTSSYYKSGDEGDFSQSVANRLNIPIGKNPVVFVIKKNKSILENLIDWFSKNENIKIIDGTPKLFDVPVLIIDDEADAASVNTAKDIDDIKTINKLIRTLLTIFNQNTFIGYTATPYANLFISQDHNEELTTTVKNKIYKIGEDLFPRDFIINIKAPTNYIGAAKIFGFENPNGTDNEPLDIFRAIDDFDPPFFRTINKHNKADLPEYLPKSLEKAIKSFILTCAIRRVRGQEKKHNSMLIHVALLVKWIDRVAYLVNDKMREYKNAIDGNDELLLIDFEHLYKSDFLPTTENVLENLDYTDIRIKVHSWEDVKKELKKAASKIEVRSVHGTRSTTNLEYHKIEEIDYSRYDNGFSVIAVGGSRLSRGITLEGLSISYYLRTTKMYDSLMQMGRWFGYRPGYVDLCRLYTTEQIFEWFNHITMATEEMRDDFDEMTAALQKPKDFKLKVRNHSGLMTITSLAKLYHSDKIEISFSGTNPQTYQLLKTKTAIENNFKLFKELLNIGNKKTQIIKHKELDLIPRYILIKDFDKEKIASFLDNYKIDLPKIKNAQLGEYILKQSEIKEWSVAIVSNTDSDIFIDEKGKSKKGERSKNKKLKTYTLSIGSQEITLGCSVRNQQLNRNSEYYHISKNQIDDTIDRQIDLTKTEIKLNSEIKLERSKEKKGLLLIYALDERGTPNVKNDIPIIGYSLHFPTIQNEKKVSYTATINNGFDEETQEDDDLINEDE
ncbi:Z1 domain-containing protein [Flavobacterium degerlachei]|uniref:Z1 domain-containing protein n=1 Tax=Flavobacterium degerlachei TaxID=229203 RepID=A0A1H2R5T6_9FLAO|nr:Z1 domain-containing protein [Flavobacterium degerlachei]SDW14490.1 Z1 domain-containing protein [Flavobacterium degerlachei]